MKLLVNRRQAARLKDLSDTANKHHRYFMFELLVPPTAEQNERVKGKKKAAKCRGKLS